MEELKDVLERLGYRGDVPALPPTGSKKFLKFIGLVVGELKSCENLTGEPKRRFDEMRQLSNECSKENFEQILEKRRKEQLEASEKDKLESAELEEKVRPLRERLHTLNHIHKKLSEQHEQCIKEKDSLMLHLANCQSDYQEASEQSKLNNKKVNASLSKLQAAGSEVFDMYSRQLKLQREGGSDVDHVFLSSISPLPYHESEGKFTKTLTQFAKKQFPPGVDKMANTSDTTNYTLMDDTQLLRHLSEEEYQKNLTELKRLQSIFPIVESQKLAYEVSKASSQASSAMVREHIESVKKGEGVIKESNETLRQMIDSKEQHLSELKSKIDTLTNQTIPQQLNDLSSLRTSHIVHGDYDLKLARQSYYITRQEKILHGLKEQRSRQELYSMLLEVEFRYHRDTHRLLLAAVSQLEKWKQETEERQKNLQDLPVNPSGNPANETDDTIMKLLDIKSFTSLEDLREKVSGVFSEGRRVQSQLEEEEMKLCQQVDALKSQLIELEKCVFGTNNEKTLNFVPKDLDKGIRKLQDLLSSIEQGIKNVLKDYEQKKKILQTSSLVRTEKELFVYFFTDKQKLSTAMSNLAHRVNSLSSNISK